jgi:hypothetical protein
MLKIAVVGFLLIGPLGCSSDSSKILGPKNADISGEIQQITVAADGTGEVRLAILGTGPDGGSNEHLFVVVDPGTPISLPSKPGAHTGSISDLVVGADISANVDPAVIDTFPPQYLATEIQIGGASD